MKRKVLYILVSALVISTVITGCGMALDTDNSNDSSSEFVNEQNANGGIGGSEVVTADSSDSASVSDNSGCDESSVTSESDNLASNKDNKVTVIDTSDVTNDALFESFIHNEIPAICGCRKEGYEVYAKDLPLVEEASDFSDYTVGDMIDLDNDGEDELILNGPYGGMFLDADTDEGSVLILARGDGTAINIAYTEFEGAMWIVYYDVTHSGREQFSLDKYEGIDNKVDSFELSAIYEGQDDYDENSTFMYRDNPITMEEYENLKKEILGE